MEILEKFSVNNSRSNCWSFVELFLGMVQKCYAKLNSSRTTLATVLLEDPRRLVVCLAFRLGVADVHSPLSIRSRRGVRRGPPELRRPETLAAGSRGYILFGAVVNRIPFGYRYSIAICNHSDVDVGVGFPSRSGGVDSPGRPEGGGEGEGGSVELWNALPYLLNPGVVLESMEP